MAEGRGSTWPTNATSHETGNPSNPADILLAMFYQPKVAAITDMSDTSQNTRRTLKTTDPAAKARK